MIFMQSNMQSRQGKDDIHSHLSIYVQRLLYSVDGKNSDSKKCMHCFFVFDVVI